MICVFTVRVCRLVPSADPVSGRGHRAIRQTGKCFHRTM